MKSKHVEHVRVSILLPKELVEELDRIAAHEGRNRLGQARFLGTDYVSRHITAIREGNAMTVVLQFEPVWGTAESVTALYGIPRRRLLDLARCGHIRARKLSPDSRSSTIVFRTADVKEWLEDEAPKPRAEAFAPTRGPGVPRTGDDGM